MDYQTAPGNCVLPNSTKLKARNPSVQVSEQLVRGEKSLQESSVTAIV